MTWHEDGAATAAAEMMAEPHGAEAIGVYYEGLREGRWDQEFLDVVGQLDRRQGSWDLGQVYSFMRFHHAWVSGRYAACSVPVGGPPGPDADREGNAALLGTVPHYVTGDLDARQNNADEDGVLSWADDLRMTAFVADQELVDGVEAKTLDVRVKPMQVPLEVGTTKPSRSWLHMQREGGLARWPYGQDRITLWVRLHS